MKYKHVVIPKDDHDKIKAYKRNHGVTIEQIMSDILDSSTFYATIKKDVK